MIFIDPRFGERKHQSGAAQRAFYRKTFETFEVPSTDEHLLNFGDFSFIGNGPEGPIKIGIELKAIADFVQSMRSGRLAGHQVPGLLETYRGGRIYLIVEGLFRLSRRNGALEVPRGQGYRPMNAGPRPVFWSDIKRFMRDLEEVGIRLEYTRSQYETAYLLGRVLYPWWQKPYDQHKGLSVLYNPEPGGVFLRNEDPNRQRLRRVVHSLGVGLGWERSQDVADRFSSVRMAINGTREQWESVPGVGKHIAEEVTRVINTTVPVRRGHVSTRDQSNRQRVRTATKRKD